MVMFCAYIYIILNYSASVPCSCGGIIEKLGWKEHLVFNLFFVLLAVAGWLLAKQPGNPFKAALILLCLGFTAILVVTFLYLSSERIIYTENPFIRRYTHGVIKTGEIDLGSNACYFAGSEAGTVFLGNYSNPLKIMITDTALRTPTEETIRVREADLPSIASQVRIEPPAFYLVDGQISRILKGSTTDWETSQRWDGTIRFSNYQLAGDHTIAFRAFMPGKKEQVLGCLSLADSLPYTLTPGLLEKQVDGDFGVDGTLSYDRGKEQVVYTYYYRNSYLVANSLLELKARRNTIDTVTQVRLVIDTLANRYQRKLISALMVNASAFATDGMLYVRSKIKGRYQPEKTWKQTGTIDVYDLSTGNYRTSFYVYKTSGKPVRQFFIIGKNFYGFAGNKLVRYNLGSMLNDYE